MDLPGGNRPLPVARLVRPTSHRLATALLFGLAVGAWSAPVAAAESLTGGPPTAAANHYTTGQRGSKLRWLPYRSGKRLVDAQVVRAQHVVTGAPAVARIPANRRLGSDPFRNPFGDSQPKPPTAAPPVTFQDEALKKPKVPPLLIGSHLQFPDEQPVAPPDVEPAESGPAEGQAEMQQPAGDQTDEGAGALEIPVPDEETVTSPAEFFGECPEPEDAEFFTPIGELSSDTSVEGDEERPAGERRFPPVCPLGDETFDPNALRPWCPTTFTWKASGLCHKPLYFEDVQLERYGHSWGPYLQPVISGAHFFLTVPALPYAMGLYPPKECVYTLGYYRPGNCAPYMIDPVPLSIRAGLAEGGIWTGAVFLIP